MVYVSAAEMREADRRCIEVIGIPGAVLMNNAGAAVFREIERGPVGIVCGKGNNGGDGFVVARYALLAGMDPRVVLLARRSEIQGEAAVFMHAYERLGGNLIEANDESSASREVANLANCATLVDAMLGTGVTGPVRGACKAAIEHWPGVPTIAVDVPSGMNCDTGEPNGACIRASVTVTFQFGKKGFANPAAKLYLGRLVVADIGIPSVCADDAAWAELERSIGKRD